MHSKKSRERNVLEKVLTFDASLNLDEFKQTLERLDIFIITAPAAKNIRRLTEFLKRNPREAQSLECKRECLSIFGDISIDATGQKSFMVPEWKFIINIRRGNVRGTRP